MRRKTLVVVVAVAVVACSLITAYFVARHKILYHFDVVDPGKVYRSGTLSDWGLRWARSISGFKTIVNVRSEKENREPWHEEETRFALANGIKLIDMPLKADTPPSPAQCEKFLEIVNEPKNLPVIIHCHQGVTRTAMMVAVYEIAVEGRKNDDVLRNMETFGHSFDKPDKKDVRDFILHYSNGRQLEK